MAQPDLNKIAEHYWRILKEIGADVMGGFKWLSDGLAELRRMRIAGELQGRGYGTLLLRELERRAFQSGVRILCLDTARRRPLTLQFYRKHGYQETGQSFYGDVGTVQFSKNLDARILGE